MIVRFWGKKELKAERDLLAQKQGWFDIRRMPPVSRTEHFAWVFTEQTRIYIRRYLDDAPPAVGNDGKVRDWNPIKAGDIFEEMPSWDGKRIASHKRKIGSLIRARQWCDSMNIPYEQAIKTALKEFYFERGYLRDHRSLPDPSMMNGVEMRQVILVKWVEALEGRIQCAKDDRFIIRGEPTEEQAEHEKWVLDQIERRGSHAFTVKNFVGKGIVTAEAAERRFGSRTNMPRA